MKTNIPRYKNYSPRKLNITRGDKIFPAEMKCENNLPKPKYSSQPKDFPRRKKSSPRPRNYSPRQNYSPWPRKHSPRKKIFSAAQKIFPAAQKIFPAEKIFPAAQKIFPAAQKIFPAEKIFPAAHKIFPAAKKYSFLCPSKASVVIFYHTNLFIKFRNYFLGLQFLWDTVSEFTHPSAMFLHWKCCTKLEAQDRHMTFQIWYIDLEKQL